MVLKKRGDYGFQGYQLQAIPRGPRSVRKRGPGKKLAEESQISAFELLAAVAGKLLDSENCASHIAEEGINKLEIPRHGISSEHFQEETGRGSECLDQGSCLESAIIPDSSALKQKSEVASEKIPCNGHDSVMEHNSVVMNPALPKDFNVDLKLEICSDGNSHGDRSDKVKGGSSNLGNLTNNDMINGADRQVADDKKQTGALVDAFAGCLRDQAKQYVNINSYTQINSEGSVHLPICRDSAFSLEHSANVKLGSIRDDDENSFGCNSTKVKAFRPQSRSGYRRIRKILTSKYRRVVPRWRHSHLANSYEGMRPFYRSKKHLYPRERCQHEPLSKRRKLFDRSFVVARDWEVSTEKISKLSDMVVRGDEKVSAAYTPRASGPSASVKDRKKSGNTNVKFSIKSFKVPELYIEVPETSTVGALKKSVVEAVSTIFGGGLRVGMVLKGKRIRDDKRTLQQAGISNDNNFEALGFTLEPNFNQVYPSMSLKQFPALHPHGAGRLPSRAPAKPELVLGHPISTSNDTGSVSKIDEPGEVRHEVGPRTPCDAFTDGAMQDSKALIAVPAMNKESLALVKPKHSELPQRRTRRPFSVGEVEALVEAVETLGTGRWRDVKIRAFDNADHRTYVDLKDKWKTLVHTASISPQQRRGEPVPQELLHRVLSAHAYWSQLQSKQYASISSQN